MVLDMIKAFGTFNLPISGFVLLMCLKIVIEIQREAFIKSASWLIVG